MTFLVSAVSFSDSKNVKEQEEKIEKEAEASGRASGKVHHGLGRDGKDHRDT